MVEQASYPSWDTAKIQRFRRRLVGWYERHGRKLPWRDHPEPYHVWISEIMLQQTQVRTALPFYQRFLLRFPTIESLAQAKETAVLAAWAGLGYYSRARNLHRAARIIHETGEGFPSTYDEILRLPGVGRYTAGAILSIALNQPYPIVDGNVRRVMLRLHGLEGRVPESFFWNQASAWVSERNPSAFNQGVMELGALVCLPSNPSCSHCPVEPFCLAKARGIQARIPPAKTRVAEQSIRLVTLVLRKGASVVVQNAGSEDDTSFIPGEWRLPTIRRNTNASALAMAGELLQSVLGRSLRLRDCGSIRHSITFRRLHIAVFSTEVRRPLSDAISPPFRWIRAKENVTYLTSSAFRKALRASEESR